MVGEGKRKRTIAIEEAVVTTAVVIAGLALQFTLGSFDKAFLAFPVNIIVPLLCLPLWVYTITSEL